MNTATAYLRKTNLAALDANEIEGPSADSIADDIAAFLDRYLACEPYQLGILALWVIYTRCFQHFPTATYLSISSPEPQSGKSLCVELLEMLCDSPWMIRGADPRTITSQLLNSNTRIRRGEDVVCRPPFTILLDDCHHAFHGSERQPLVAIFNSGAQVSGRYLRYSSEYCVFGPRAFAGNASLPPSLASRCIPIVLHRKRPSDIRNRFHHGLPPDDVDDLLQRIAGWVQEKDEALAELADQTPAGLPAGLAPREQACSEPLLHIADLIGGSWPEKARAAVAAIFQLAESSRAVQLLCDLRMAFAVRGNPDYLPTSDLLAEIRTLEHRPWSAWPRNSGRRLGTLLHPFGIVSRNLRINTETVLRGYLLQDFQDIWARYLPYAACSATDFTCATQSATESAAENGPGSAKAD